MSTDLVPLAAAPPATFRIDPLPDFLADHTLLADDLPGRLQEHTRRWTQVIRSLWAWQNATFTLRYRTHPSWPTLLVTVQGTAESVEKQAQLDADLEMRFNDFGINISRMLDAPDPLAWAENACVYEVRQRQETGIWQADANKAGGGANLYLANLGDVLSAHDIASPPVVFPWRGPGGTFQLPVKALLSLGVAAEFSVHIRPVTLQPSESQFLRIAAAEAEAKGRATASVGGGTGSISFADPAAAFAARLYLSQYRRLANPFLVVIRCAAATVAVAKSIAATLEAVVLEPPLEPAVDPEEARLPPGADVLGLASNHSRDVFPKGKSALARLSYLADAAGAATVFRLPVSVNGGVAGIETRQRVPDFHPGPRVMHVPPEHIDLGQFADGSLATMKVKELTKHALITGFTGSGKTVTVLRLLHQLYAMHKVPFLVLESAKQEYRGLFGVTAFADFLRVYTLGNETAVPFRLNPFELLPGVRVEAHVGRLQVCFEAAIPPIGPSASVIAEALVDVYAKRGWTITNACPKETDAPPKRQFPTMSEFVKTVEEVIEGRKYAPEVKANVTAAIVGRLRPLLFGSKGRMFDCQHSVPNAKELFGLPTVLEMNDLNADDKALVVMFLLTLLREYRERNPGKPDTLAHVTVVEEAHNVLAAVRSAGTGEGAGADTKFKAVEAFCALLTEVRALGEGLIIADQSPEKLAADAMRNTNLQIAHQLRDGHDRDAIANAMIMTDEQRDYLGKLLPGRAAMFRTGLERATFVTVPMYYPPPEGPKEGVTYLGKDFIRNMSDADVIALMEARVTVTRRLELPLAGCELCEVKDTCPHGDAMWAEFESGQGRVDLLEFGKLQAKKPLAVDLWTFIRTAANGAAVRLGAEAVSPQPGAGWCYFNHLWHKHHGEKPPPRLTAFHVNMLSTLDDGGP